MLSICLCNGTDIHTLFSKTTQFSFKYQTENVGIVLVKLYCSCFSDKHSLEISHLDIKVLKWNMHWKGYTLMQIRYCLCLQDIDRCYTEYLFEKKMLDFKVSCYCYMNKNKTSTSLKVYPSLSIVGVTTAYNVNAMLHAPLPQKNIKQLKSFKGLRSWGPGRSEGIHAVQWGTPERWVHLASVRV